MISLWPHWQRPFFIILLPVILYLLWKLWHLHETRGSWHKLIPASFQPWLLRGTSAKESASAKLLISIASLFALLALLGPSWTHIEQPPLKMDAPLVIVMDMTPRMLSSDIPPNRLQSAKLKLTDIINARKDAQTAIVVYAGTAHTVVPLSDDKATITNLINSLSPTIMPRHGERADLGIAKAIQLINNTQQNSETKHAEILLITTGLTAEEQTNIKQLLTGKSFTLSILGVGTAQGAPILMNDGSFLRDQSNRIILPKLDRIALQDFAYSEGGYYSTITLDNDDIKTLNLADVKGEKRQLDDLETQPTDLWQDQGYWLLLPLLLIAAFAGRKGWLFCIPLLCLSLSTQPAHAFEWSKLWLNQNQQGQKLLDEQKPAEAAKRFNNKQWQGYSSYQAKDYQQAAKQFAKDTTPEGIYNYGNTLARQGKYEEAIAQWDKAIKAKPNFEPAIVNKKIVEELLKKQKDQQQQEQNQQQKDKDQQQEKNKQQQQQDGQQQSGNSQQTEEQPQIGEQPQTEQSQAGNSNQQQQQDSQPQDAEQMKQQDGQATDQKNTEQKQLQQAELSEKEQAEQQAKEAKQADALHQQEQNEILMQQIRNIPDDPSELLRRKFYYEQRYNKGDY